MHRPNSFFLRSLPSALAGCVIAVSVFSTPAIAGKPQVVVYDTFSKPSGAPYTITDYAAKWGNPYGLGEMQANDTRSFAGGRFTVKATPFTVGDDYSVFDHLKYIAISTVDFPAPVRGSITFSSVIQAETRGTRPGHVVRGIYVQSGAPYAAKVLEGQQAGVVMNVIDFGTGQLFDWFVSGSKAFTLIERLPTNVTGNGGSPGDPGYVGRSKMYTQIIDEVSIGPGPHKVAIKFTRKGDKGTVEYFLDGKRISKVKDVGVPLDVQRRKYTGIYPSLGPGEKLAPRLNRFVIGHGLFSLLDAFPFQHPEAPELSVSIPMSERLFGQGAKGSFDDFTVTTDVDDVGDDD